VPNQPTYQGVEIENFPSFPHSLYITDSSEVIKSLHRRLGAMTEQMERGSSKLWMQVFEENAPTDEALNAALAVAAEKYKVLRWWKYGQPAIDRIKATFEVSPRTAGEVIQSVLDAHGTELQVNLDVFPYGIPRPERVHINVLFERNVPGK
jgi:hypothetical protein